MSVQEITQSYDCKTADCPNEARSRVGRYAYCDYCRTQKEAEKPLKVVPGFEKRARDLISAGKNLDKARAQAERAIARVRAAQASWDQARATIDSPAGNGNGHHD